MRLVQVFIRWRYKSCSLAEHHYTKNVALVSLSWILPVWKLKHTVDDKSTMMCVVRKRKFKGTFSVFNIFICHQWLNVHKYACFHIFSGSQLCVGKLWIIMCIVISSDLKITHMMDSPVHDYSETFTWLSTQNYLSECSFK